MEDMHLALYLIAAMLLIYYVLSKGGISLSTALTLIMVFYGLSAAVGGIGVGALTSSSALIGLGGAAAFLLTASHMQDSSKHLAI